MLRRKFQKGGTLPEVTVHGFKKRETNDAYSFIQEHSPDAYNALIKLGEAYGFSSIKMPDERPFYINDRVPANYNPLTNTTNIYDTGDPVEPNVMADYMARKIIAELPHKIQFDNDSLGSVKKWITQDLPTYIKGTRPYSTSGTLENDAHSEIEPTLMQQYQFLRTGKSQKAHNLFQLGGMNNNFVNAPLLEFLKQMQAAKEPQDANLTGGPDNWKSYTPQGPRVESNPQAMFSGNRQPIAAPNIDVTKALAGTGGPDATLPPPPGQSNRQGFNPTNLINLINTGLLGISDKYKKDQQQQYVNQNLNNPYMGTIASSNGESDPVRYGYQTYQKGGRHDALTELFNEVYASLEDDSVEHVEPPTESQVEAVENEQQQEAERARRKQISRDIMNSFQPQQYSQNQEDQYSEEGVASVNTGAPTQNAQVAFDHYISKGLPEHVAAGIVGNLQQESGLNPHIKGDSGKATGIAQWWPDRFKGLQKWAKNEGRNPYDLKTQLDYVLIEPGEGQKALNALFQTSTPAEAAHAFSAIYERPNKRFAANSKRAGYAESLIRK